MRIYCNQSFSSRRTMSFWRLEILQWRLGPRDNLSLQLRYLTGRPVNKVWDSPSKYDFIPFFRLFQKWPKTSFFQFKIGWENVNSFAGVMLTLVNADLVGGTVLLVPKLDLFLFSSTRPQHLSNWSTLVQGNKGKVQQKRKRVFSVSSHITLRF